MPVESFEDAAREIRDRVAAGYLDPNLATIRLLALALEARRGPKSRRSVRRQDRRG
jgi:hypothetical protein